MDLPNSEPPSCSEIHSVPPYNGNQVAGVKVEEVTNVKEEEDPASISSPVTKTEHRVSCLCVNCYTHFTNMQNCLHLCLSTWHIGERIVTVLVKKCEGRCILWYITCEIPLPICLKSVSRYLKKWNQICE